MYLRGGKCRIVDIDSENICFEGKCVSTGKMHRTPMVPRIALLDLYNGAHMQDAFPMLPAPEREFLISGFSPEAWEKMFPPEDTCYDDETI